MSNVWLSNLPEWLEEARERGAEAARNAASWAADGNSDTDAIRRTLKMLDDGDPQAADYLPEWPSLSGEWADDATPLSLARSITGAEDVPGDVVDALAEAWEAGVAEAFEPACEAALRAWLPDDDGACPMCGAGPLDLKGYGGICPNGHIIEGV